MVRASLAYSISRSGRPCTNDPERASYRFAIIGEPNRMFECMEIALRLKQSFVGAKVNPGFDPYRDDPRFTALLRRMNLADEGALKLEINQTCAEDGGGRRPPAP